MPKAIPEQYGIFSMIYRKKNSFAVVEMKEGKLFVKVLAKEKNKDVAQKEPCPVGKSNHKLLPARVHKINRFWKIVSQNSTPLFLYSALKHCAMTRKRGVP